MEQATDTNNGSNKRTRFDTTAHVPATEDTKDAATSPMSVASQHIRTHLTSLRPQIATILEKLAFAVLRLQAKQHNKQRQISKMESDAEFIPRSTRLKFELTASKTAELSMEFVALKDETLSLIHI